RFSRDWSSDVCSSDLTDESGTEGEGSSKAGTAEGEPQQGGTLVYGIDAPPEGLFSSAFYGIATDAEVIDLFDEALISYNENLERSEERRVGEESRCRR